MSDDETSSHSSQSSLSVDDENMPENVIRPNQFEPEFSSSDEGVGEGKFDREQHDIFSNLNNFPIFSGFLAVSSHVT